jgi:hypothetical protein
MKLTQWMIGLGLIVGMSLTTLAQSASTAFGFQCGAGVSTNCPNEAWPTTIAQPGLIRLWDSQVQWAGINTVANTYKWTRMDAWLDVIAAHQPRAVMYTFGHVPCWDGTGACGSQAGENTNPSAPADLAPGGSPAFNAFVTALVNHCSPAGHCVKDLIKYWEIWNEANSSNYWGGTIPQLYQLAVPAIAIVKANISGARILTPPVSGGNTSWMASWLNTENTNGRLSDIYAFHIYLQGQTPEARYPGPVQNMVNLKNNTAGWASTPWMNTETAFQSGTYVCSGYTAPDCTGQAVRWYLLHLSNGAQNLSWFYFNTVFGPNAPADNAYFYMMQWLVGSRFTGPCSANGTVWTCNLTLANTHTARAVWDTSGTSTYTPPAGVYSQYRDSSGGTTPLGTTVTIGFEPVLLEKATNAPQPPLPPRNLTAIPH